MPKIKFRAFFPGVLAGLCLSFTGPAMAQIGPGFPGVDPGDVADDFGAAVDAIFPVIDFTDFLPPKVGYSYVDPIFGSVIKRVSDARATPDHAGGGILPLISHEYSTVTPFNADNTRLLLLHFSYFALYDGQGNYLRDLPFDVNSSSQPRWSETDPDIFYYLSGNELREYDVSTHERRTLHVFREYERITGLGESELSADGNHLVLVGDHREIFVYTISTGGKGPVLHIAPGSVDHVVITPKNNVLVGWYETGGGRRRGLEMFDRNMTFLRQLSPVLGHMDVGIDTTGEEIVLMHNSAHPNPPDDCQNAVVKIRLRTGRQSCVLPFDWGIGIHISAPLEGDWFIVSTYSSDDPSLPPPGTAMRYRDEILRVKLDGSRIERLAHHWSAPYDNYSFQPKASVSHDGSRIVYGSNYHRQEKSDVPAIYTDAFLLCLDCAEDSRERRWIRNEEFKLNLLREEESIGTADFEGPWHNMFHSLLSAESVLVSSTPGAKVSYTFEGPVIGWVGYKGPLAGVAEVFVDGESKGLVDGYQSKHKMQAHLFIAQGLSPGEHTLTIEVKARPAWRGGQGWVWIDAFDTRPYAPTAAELLF